MALWHVDQRSVAVQLAIGDRQRVFRGWGTFVNNRAGGLLKILCGDTAGSFELLIRAGEWNGQVERGASFGCDYFIQLAQPC